VADERYHQIVTERRRRPLAGWRVLVTRPADRRRRCSRRCAPRARAGRLSDDHGRAAAQLGRVRSARRRAAGYGWVVLTSPSAVRLACARARVNGGWPAWRGAHRGGGPATARALAPRG
jgi:uroporphyrinogen-III synthase